MFSFCLRIFLGYSSLFGMSLSLATKSFFNENLRINKIVTKFHQSRLYSNEKRISAAVLNSNIPVSGKLDLNPPKGTRDFFPEDQRLRNWLFGVWKNTAKEFAFEEYDAPVVESEDLYIRKAGEEITQQLYNFEDKGGRRLSLRPEMTPSLARMVLSRKGSLSFPLKWFSIPQCWRYERMTRGRRREHFQWNMDMWGIPGVEAEAEVLSAIVSSLKKMGLKSSDVGIKINNRKILACILSKAGVEDSKFAEACILIGELKITHEIFFLLKYIFSRQARKS